MNHSLTTSTKKLTKKALLTTALLSSLLVVGCGTKKSEPENKAEADTAVTKSAKASTDNVAASAIVDQVLGTMGSAMKMANQMAEQSKGKAQFTNEQISCFMTHENNLAIDGVQKYLESSFSKDEIKTLNDFFGSAAGKKQIEMTKKMVSSMMEEGKLDLKNPQDLLSEDEQKKIGEFWMSEVGSKLQTALNDKTKLEPFIQPFIAAKEEKCAPKEK